jgi:hypothetical protein
MANIIKMSEFEFYGANNSGKQIQIDDKIGRVSDLPVRKKPARPGEYDRYWYARWFIHLFAPRFDVYAMIDDDPQACQGWIFKEEQLSLGQIEQAFNNPDGSFIAWYSLTSPRAICLRIEADFISWDRLPEGEVEVSANLLPEYRTTVSRFPVPPSMVALESYGLLVFYLLKDGIYCATLETMVSSMLWDSSTRFIQTVDHGLQIPKKMQFLDSTALASGRWDFCDEIDWERVPVYQPSQIFGADWRSRLVVTTAPRIQYIPKESIAKAGLRHELTSRSVPTVEEVETLILPFRKEVVDEQLFVSVLACHKDGMDADQIQQRVASWIDKSPQCKDQLKLASTHELYERIEVIRGLAHLVHWPLPATAISNRNIEPIAERQPFGAKHIATVWRFLIELSQWQRLHDQVGSDPDLLAMFNDKYPFYRHHRCLGLYPLPSKVTEQWAPDYSRYIEWVTDIGVLHDAGFEYCTDGVCRYYFITFADVHIENQQTID